MRPFITPELLPDGKLLYPYQCEGIDCMAIGLCLEGLKIVAVELPEGHTLHTTWEFALVFDSGAELRFSSSCTEVVDWQEVGSLNIWTPEYSTVPSAGRGVVARSCIEAIKVNAVEKLIYEDEDVIVECGLVICGARDQNVVIAAGISPGSVSVMAPFSKGYSFEPQFPLEMCRHAVI